MSNKLVLNWLEKLYERLGEPQRGDVQVYLGKNFSKADLFSELDHIAALVCDDEVAIDNIAQSYIYAHQGELEL